SSSTGTPSRVQIASRSATLIPTRTRSNCITQVIQREPYIQTLAEQVIAAKPSPMRRLLALLLILCLVPSGCRKEPEGAVKVVVIGGAPQLRDPALGPLPEPDRVLLDSVAQGLVRFDAA